MSLLVGALVGIPISVATSLTIVLKSDAYKAIEEKMKVENDTYNGNAQTALINSLGAGIVGGLFCGVIGGNLSNRIIKDYGLIGGIGGGITAGIVSGLRNIPKLPESSGLQTTSEIQ